MPSSPRHVGRTRPLPPGPRVPLRGPLPRPPRWWSFRLTKPSVWACPWLPRCWGSTPPRRHPRPLQPRPGTGLPADGPPRCPVRRRPVWWGPGGEKLGNYPKCGRSDSPGLDLNGKGQLERLPCTEPLCFPGTRSRTPAFGHVYSCSLTHSGPGTVPG